MPTTDDVDRAEEQRNMPPQNVKMGLLWLSIIFLAGAVIVGACWALMNGVIR
jgi:hypothetical protein